ncbi:MAG: phosphodiester glycosidase family protein [Oscillospiraceae bacterium]|nr:phosphodiester glycosidase family protein [Oscillospiraceae bacterium]
MKKLTPGKIAARVVLVLLTAAALLLIAAAGAVWVVLRGPSPAAREMLTRSMKETSAIGFIPDLFLSEEAVAEIMSYREEVPETEQVDTSLVTITATKRETAHTAGPAAGSGGEASQDAGDGIEFIGITGANYRGILMVVEDPFRLFVGTPDSYGGAGLTLEQMIEKYDALAGINGGGFYDPGGGGNGGTPDGIVITDGELKWGFTNTTTTVIGFDGNGILHVGWMSAQDALDRDIRWACSFGPALIVNGEAQTGAAITSSGMNPRTAIGQREDGAVLLLVVDGRQITSLGATYEDLISIMLEHGAVNAANLDGGSSSQMIYQGEAKNINASVIGTRPLPTAFLVRK